MAASRYASSVQNDRAQLRILHHDREEPATIVTKTEASAARDAAVRERNELFRASLFFGVAASVLASTVGGVSPFELFLALVVFALAATLGSHFYRCARWERARHDEFWASLFRESTPEDSAQLSLFRSPDDGRDAIP